MREQSDRQRESSEVLDRLDQKQRTVIVIQGFAVSKGEPKAHDFYVYWLSIEYQLPLDSAYQLLEDCLNSADIRELFQAGLSVHPKYLSEDKKKDDLELFDIFQGQIPRWTAVQAKHPSNYFDYITSEIESQLKSIHQDYIPSLESTVVCELSALAENLLLYSKANWWKKRQKRLLD